MHFILLILFTLQSAAFAAPRLPSPWDQVLLPIERPQLRCGFPNRLDDDSLHFYDVVQFEPHLSFNFADHTISGYCEIRLTTVEATLDRIDFRFTHSLTIDSVWAIQNFTTTLESAGDDSIQVYLSPPLLVGDTITVGIAYHGTPEIIDSWGGFRWGNAQGFRPEIAFSMGDGLDIEQPPANFTWFPCHADPNDKATWEAWFQVATGKTAVSNGLRIDTLNHGDSTTTWHYRLDQSVSTYLFFVSASDYVIQVQREANPRIENFVYPSRVDQALVHFANVPAVLDAWVELFGPYPFDRMGYNMTRLGDMEHATCVSHIDTYVQPNNVNDWLLFHEMSHMWWGNWVTCGDWRDLWLNEGFATYCEALGYEALNGHDAYMDYIVINLFPSGRGATDSYSIYDPDFYWGATVYQKGACVMHMLRYVVGDSLFFQAWREYGQEHAYGTAVTSEWQAKLEEHYGESLDWFFQPWVYGTRYPRYQAHYIQTNPTIQLLQVQTTQTLFAMPMDIACFTAANDTFVFTAWTDAVEEQTIQIPDSILDHAVLGLQLDPSNKILKTSQVFIADAADENLIPHPSSFVLTSVFPNPFNPSTTLTFALPRTSPVTLFVFDLLGREVDHVALGSFPAGVHSYQYDGSRHSSGVYLLRLETDAEVQVAKAVLLK